MNKNLLLLSLCFLLLTSTVVFAQPPQTCSSNAQCNSQQYCDTRDGTPGFCNSCIQCQEGSRKCNTFDEVRTSIQECTQIRSNCKGWTITSAACIDGTPGDTATTKCVDTSTGYDCIPTTCSSNAQCQQSFGQMNFCRNQACQTIDCSRDPSDCPSGSVCAEDTRGFDYCQRTPPCNQGQTCPQGWICNGNSCQPTLPSPPATPSQDNNGLIPGQEFPPATMNPDAEETTISGTAPSQTNNPVASGAKPRTSLGGTVDTVSTTDLCADAKTRILKVSDITGGQAALYTDPTYTACIPFAYTGTESAASLHTCGFYIGGIFISTESGIADVAARAAGIDGNLVLKLSDVTNAHAAGPGQSTSFATNVCYSPLKNCQTVSGTCPTGKRPIFYLSDSTNAHISPLTLYSPFGTTSKTVCCEIVAGSGTVPPPILTPVCGNGVREGIEQCDDGNLANGDICSSTCTISGLTIIPAAPGRACGPSSPCVNGVQCTNGICGGVTSPCTTDAQCAPELGCRGTTGNMRCTTLRRGGEACDPAQPQVCPNNRCENPDAFNTNDRSYSCSVERGQRCAQSPVIPTSPSVIGGSLTVAPSYTCGTYTTLGVTHSLYCGTDNTCGGGQARCTRNEQCSSNSCVNNRCTTPPEPRAPCSEGSSCTGGSLCMLNNGRRECPALEDGKGPCTKNEHCLNNLCDTTTQTCIGKKENGNPCTSNTECRSNKCFEGTCQTSTTAATGGNVGNSCSTTRPCLTGIPCADGLCGGRGATCTLDTQCASGTCVGGSCTAPSRTRRPGDSCTTTSFCITGVDCFEGTCGKVGARCTENNQCNSGLCEGTAGSKTCRSSRGDGGSSGTCFDINDEDRDGYTCNDRCSGTDPEETVNSEGCNEGQRRRGLPSCSQVGGLLCGLNERCVGVDGCGDLTDTVELGCHKSRGSNPISCESSIGNPLSGGQITVSKGICEDEDQDGTGTRIIQIGSLSVSDLGSLGGVGSLIPECATQSCPVEQFGSNAIRVSAPCTLIPLNEQTPVPFFTVASLSLGLFAIAGYYIYKKRKQ
ncbi:MAG: hypothetical protein WC595_02165 [Candidatus Nanoarchaeia archaeon]